MLIAKSSIRRHALGSELNAYECRPFLGGLLTLRLARVNPERLFAGLGAVPGKN